MTFKDGIAAFLLILALITPKALLADDEGSAFIDFQRLVRTADPKLVAEASKRDNPAPPTRADVEKIVGRISLAAVTVMDRAGEFKKRYPQSQRLAEIHRAALETMWTVFGSKGFPIPHERVADVAACSRAYVLEAPTDFRPHMILCRVAAAYPIAQQHELYEELSRETTPEPARSMAREALRKLERVGVPLDLSFTALDGRKVALAELKGKVVLVDFWSTTCLPCIRDLPDLKQLYSRYKDQGLEVIGISLDSDKDALERFIQKEQIHWPQYFNPAGATNHFAQAYGIRSIPVVWLVDKQGVLRQLNARENQEEKVKALLKGL